MLLIAHVFLDRFEAYFFRVAAFLILVPHLVRTHLGSILLGQVVFLGRVFLDQLFFS